MNLCEQCPLCAVDWHMEALRHIELYESYSIAVCIPQMHSSLCGYFAV